jgi:glycosyltransferase involved in cell wall biosynthesis
MAAQTRPPDLWIVVDDGSSDSTPQILEAAQRRIPWLRVVRREDRGYRKLGGGVIDTFYAGVDTVDISYEFIAKSRGVHDRRDGRGAVQALPPRGL